MTNEHNETFGQALKRNRVTAGVSQSDLAELVKVSDTAVGHWEHNESLPVIENLERLTKLFPELECWREHVRTIRKPVGPAGMSFSRDIDVSVETEDARELGVKYAEALLQYEEDDLALKSWQTQGDKLRQLLAQSGDRVAKVRKALFDAVKAEAK